MGIVAKLLFCERKLEAYAASGWKVNVECDVKSFQATGPRGNVYFLHPLYCHLNGDDGKGNWFSDEQDIDEAEEAYDLAIVVLGRHYLSQARSHHHSSSLTKK